MNQRAGADDRCTKLAKVFRFVFSRPPRAAPISARSASSGLFDPVFYRNNYPGLRPIFRRFPVRHYVAIGEREALQAEPGLLADLLPAL